ncbi:DUF4913 domain-containing protein [Nocardia sp. NPDC059228]|uniref:DUF4913 domain-containing protein n=1 Tax=Nocardia sp. NPDC059228 TaxID=3346777 RepID=UPI003683DAFF
MHEPVTAHPAGRVPGRRYKSLGLFLTNLVAPAYGRQVAVRNDIVWCPEPWKHPGAAERLVAMWHAYEGALRSPEESALSMWWLDADAHMRALMDHAGEFSLCHKGHKTTLEPLPLNLDAAPPELFAEVTRQPATVTDTAA